jgi:hypothetical protein
VTSTSAVLVKDNPKISITVEDEALKPDLRPFTGTLMKIE